MKNRTAEPLHIRKKKEDMKGTHVTAPRPHISEKKHRHKSRSTSRTKEPWKVKEGRRNQEIYVDQKKIREMEQIQQLMQMKQKIKKELRMSHTEREMKSPLKKRKHSKSPTGRIPAPHHTHRTDIAPTSRKSKPTTPPQLPHHTLTTSKPSKHRRDERASGRFDTRDRYEGGGDRRHEGWREDGRGSGWQGDKGNNDQWTQQQGGSHDRHWNNSGGNKGRGGYGNNSGGSRGGNGPPSGYNRGGPANNMGGPSSMNPYPPPQQHNFNPYPPPKY